MSGKLSPELIARLECVLGPAVTVNLDAASPDAQARVLADIADVERQAAARRRGTESARPD